MIVEKKVFGIQDSGARQEMGGGMVRDVETDKTDYTLVLDGPMFERWAVHLTKGAKKYSARNWLKAINGTDTEVAETLNRFRRSAFRHFVQWYNGNKDEDHAAAVIFNLNGAELLESELSRRGYVASDR